MIDIVTDRWLHCERNLPSYFSIIRKELKAVSKVASVVLSAKNLGSK